MMRVDQPKVIYATAFEKAITLAILEAPFIWGMGFTGIWVLIIRDSEFWPTMALLLLYGVLLIQLAVGTYYWISGRHRQRQFKGFIADRSLLSFKDERFNDDQSHLPFKSLQEWIKSAVLGKRYEVRGKILIYSLLLTLIAPAIIPLPVMSVVAIGLLIWGLLKLLIALLRWLRKSIETFSRNIEYNHE